MLKRTLLVAGFLAVGAAGPSFAASNFQNTCSQINFAYSGNSPTLSAVCLRANGTANPTSLTLQGISNQNGSLVQASGASTFQQSCGNIQVVANNPNTVTLTALCRTSSGSSNQTNLPLNNISNNNGSLTQ
jgi:hypothetical protein